MDQSQKTYFGNTALSSFVAAEGKTVTRVVCHLWQNLVNANETVEIIDNLVLHFGADEKLTIGCNRDGDGLDVLNDFDFVQEARHLKEEFKGSIRLLAADASSTKMWMDVIGKKLQHVRLTKDDAAYLADSIMLDFGDEKREITMAPLDGLIIDFYED